MCSQRDFIVSKVFTYLRATAEFFAHFSYGLYVRPTVLSVSVTFDSPIGWLKQAFIFSATKFRILALRTRA